MSVESSDVIVLIAQHAEPSRFDKYVIWLFHVSVSSISRPRNFILDFFGTVFGLLTMIY
jgi:hypothetical protein